jgi:hypothetical protein
VWLIVPVICRVTDGHWILFLRKMGHNMYSAPKYRPSAHTHLQRQPCPGWKPSFGLTLDPLSRSVEFLLRMKNDELWALFTEAVFKYAVFARTGLRRENITSCLFQGAVRKRIHTKSTSPPPSTEPPGEQGKLFTPKPCVRDTPSNWVTLPPLCHVIEKSGVWVLQYIASVSKLEFAGHDQSLFLHWTLWFNPLKHEIMCRST